MDCKIMTEEKAKEGFKGGIDCSMLTLAHCAGKVGISETQALKATAAFGGGMWRGEVCGAAAAGLIALGLKYGNYELGDKEGKDRFLAKKAEFEKAFAEANKSLICREILGYDISNPEDMKKITEENLLMTLCPKVVCNACKILDEMI